MIQCYNGRSVFGGIVIGKFYEMKRGDNEILRSHIQDTEKEIKRYHDAKNKTLLELERMCQKAKEKVGSADALIFEMHKLLLTDEEYVNEIEKTIHEEKINAEYAIMYVMDKMLQRFSLLNEEYMSARALDIKDVSQRLIMGLQGQKALDSQRMVPAIWIMDELTPSEALQLNKEEVLALVIREGTVHSHAAILVKNLGIPAIIGVDIPKEVTIDKKTGAVDCTEGVLYVEPSQEILHGLERKKTAEEEERNYLGEALAEMNHQNQKMKLCANIGSLTDLELLKQWGVIGIGLFRSEFIFLQRDSLPSEDEQFQIYKAALEGMQGKKVVIRTLDIGSDKKCDCLEVKSEENPALGMRGIRLCLENVSLFKTQLRALYRASLYGNLRILYPMITSVYEIKKIKELIQTVKEELESEGKEYGKPEQGIMIETPAAVMISDELAKEVDFFSIGTNDLTQYCLAVDRQSVQMAPYYEAHHPAIFRMISMVVESAHKYGLDVTICGELSSDSSLTEIFYEMGVDELSVAPASIPIIGKKLRELI